MSRWYSRVRELTLQLVGTPSLTDSPAETAFGPWLFDLLAQFPYFKHHPDHLRLQSTLHDSHERSNVYALVRGNGTHTLVLAGHYDVVATTNYAALQPWAGQPDDLLPRLIADLEANACSDADRLALDDLRSGEYMPGRGALDMKSGVAIGIAVLEHWAQHPDQRGNLLLVATPDEEHASHGMRSAVAHLPQLIREWNLELVGAINLDSGSDHGDGSGRAVFLGTVGKHLPFAYLVGRDTHAGYPFDGISPTLLAAELVQRIEGNAALADAGAGVVAPPPVCLKLSDTKQHYDVTTPGAAWCYFNMLTHGRSAATVLEQFVDHTRAALDAALQHMRDQAQQYAERSATPAATRTWQAQVLTFAQLTQHVAQHTDVESLLDDLAHNADPTLDLPQWSLRVVERLWQHSGLSGPAAVIGFAGLHYPLSQVGDDTAYATRLHDAAQQHAAVLAHETDTPIQIQPFFPGISDMSFLGGTLTPDDAALIAANTPAVGTRLHFDGGTAATLNLPTINIGPWGRDYHQRIERVHMPYSFETAPELVWRVAQDVLGNK